MRILIFGAGVIGSLYAALLAEAGYDVSIYARGQRLESLTQDGLLYKSRGKIRKAPIRVLSKLEEEDRYDLVFLTVRENQLHAWQLCHLAMVVPIADAYYEAADPEHAGRNAALMRKTAKQIRDNLGAIAARKIRLSPGKMQAFRLLPTPLVGWILGFVFQSSFGDRFMYRHSMKAPDEMFRLHEQFYRWLE